MPDARNPVWQRDSQPRTASRTADLPLRALSPAASRSTADKKMLREMRGHRASLPERPGLEPGLRLKSTNQPSRNRSAPAEFPANQPGQAEHPGAEKEQAAGLGSNVIHPGSELQGIVRRIAVICVGRIDGEYDLVASKWVGMPFVWGSGNVVNRQVDRAEVSHRHI